MNKNIFIDELLNCNSDIKDFYNDLKQDVNNVSYWFPKVADCGIKVPKTFVKEIPVELFGHLFIDHPEEDIDCIYNWVKNELMPSIPDDLRGLIFIKNGAFSNKFDFSTCSIRCNALDIARSIAEINYASLMFDTGGNTEIVIREQIPYNKANTPTIYNGMPLRNEYRVFYDFDNHKALYIVNYWDYDYCNESISRNYTDKIIYNHVYDSLNKHFLVNQGRVMKMVDVKMKDVEGLSGIWSIDLLEDDNKELWLIDMAIGNRSAYWDPVKAGIK